MYFIGGVILITLCIQIYWNYKNYQQGKRQLLNEVQIALDNAVEKYYASGAQRSTRITLQQDFASEGIQIHFAPAVVLADSVKMPYLRDTVRMLSGQKFTPAKFGEKVTVEEIEEINVFRPETKIADLDTKVGRILFSMVNDSLDLQKMDSLVEEELSRKKIGVEYGLLFQRRGQKEQKLYPGLIEKASLKTESKSTWLPRNASLILYFTNETATILKANMMGILLSALLLAAVIGCLLFLLKVINDQKQLAELKNDLISNITHEFKTPLATISVAMEGILDFNKANDPEKAVNYAKASNLQVEKLNAMVEKLLETAALSGKKLELQKEEVDLVLLLESLIRKWQELAPQKSFHFNTNRAQLILSADAFHIENAFNNIFDNAVKHGGKEVTTSIDVQKKFLEIIISDSGKDLTKAQAAQVFEKFFRVPKGNTHDVKGFGIGLYYTREIIERHGGSIRAEISKNTQFVIHLPHV